MEVLFQVTVISNMTSANVFFFIKMLLINFLHIFYFKKVHTNFYFTILSSAYFVAMK